jgi:hypothetical protein
VLWVLVGYSEWLFSHSAIRGLFIEEGEVRMTVCIPFAFRSLLYSSLFCEEIQPTDLSESLGCMGEVQEFAEKSVDPEKSGSGPGKEGEERERLSLNECARWNVCGFTTNSCGIPTSR